ncbi:MAG: hypothetical protein H7249_16885 [Chitinophagaceae bacterium]|nr:hypothetical protein [Oligoflexus sp.]
MATSSLFFVCYLAICGFALLLSRVFILKGELGFRSQDDSELDAFGIAYLRTGWEEVVRIVAIAHSESSRLVAPISRDDGRLSYQKMLEAKGLLPGRRVWMLRLMVVVLGAATPFYFGLHFLRVSFAAHNNADFLGYFLVLVMTVGLFLRLVLRRTTFLGNRVLKDMRVKHNEFLLSSPELTADDCDLSIYKTAALFGADVLLKST